MPEVTLHLADGPHEVVVGVEAIMRAEEAFGSHESVVFLLTEQPYRAVGLWCTVWRLGKTPQDVYDLLTGVDGRKVAQTILDGWSKAMPVGEPDTDPTEGPTSP